jgi:hypothetical protein
MLIQTKSLSKFNMTPFKWFLSATAFLTIFVLFNNLVGVNFLLTDDLFASERSSKDELWRQL